MKTKIILVTLGAIIGIGLTLATQLVERKHREMICQNFTADQMANVRVCSEFTFE